MEKFCSYCGSKKANQDLTEQRNAMVDELNAALKEYEAGFKKIDNVLTKYKELPEVKAFIGTTKHRQIINMHKGVNSLMQNIISLFEGIIVSKKKPEDISRYSASFD